MKLKIQTKVLALLLAIALIPLLSSTFFEVFSALQLSRKLATDTRQQLLDNAYTLLSTLVDEYTQILKRDEAQILLALNLQAREVETLLASPAQNTSKLYFSKDYEQPETQPPGTEPSGKHFRPVADGKLEPIPVNYQHQVIYLPQGVQKNDVTAVLNQLAVMPEVYRLVHDIRPDLFLWQYTALEKGVHSSFPGKGGYPPEYDPRQREWYLAAKNAGRPISRVISDLSTRTLILTMAMPVHFPDGTVAGVTAIDAIYQWLLKDWTVPDSWRSVAQTMILLFDSANNRLQVIYRNDQEGPQASWQMPVESQYLEVDSPEQLAPVLADLRAGRAGIRKISQQGREYLWAYGRAQEEGPFPLISVPYQQVIAQATRAEEFAREQGYWVLKISALLLLVVVVVVSFLAIFIAKALTRPVLQLAEAAKNFSAGNYAARVSITTGDELQALGSAFNNMGVSLRERQQMKQSLALAREVQQHLLPAKTPELAGYDIFGHSSYCDETGGDYYDYVDLGNGQLGLAVGDVSGHGIGAALLMTTVRGILRAEAQHLWDKPAELLLALNRHLARDTRDDFFVTFFYALLDADQSSCHWISAGHGPSFFYSAQDQSVRELSTSGIPLGILEATSFDDAQALFMQPGDILLIGTDGLWETSNPAGELFGTSRICQLLVDNAADSATEICSAILSALDDFRGGHKMHDDQTMLIVKAS